MLSPVNKYVAKYVGIHPTDELPAFAWPGGYPLFYLDKGGAYLCPKCANDLRDDVFAADTNWEDPLLFCEECSTQIPSAYADDEEKDKV